MGIGQSAKINNYQRPIDLIEISNRGKAVTSGQKANGKSFKDMFSSELAGNRQINFSKHAHNRLFSRGITLSEDTVNRLADAVDKAQGKGSRETLIIADEIAFIVSVNNRTVVTAFDKDNLKEGIVTSIDSAVII